MHLFAILGYGIPTDIAHDENYRVYLNVAFNAIIDRAAGKPAIVTLHGGPTNCTPPYKGTEAGLMADEMKKRAARKVVRPLTKQWTLVREGKSLSTLQNILYLKDVAAARKVSAKDMTIICERTRERRIATLAKKIFGRTVTVVAIDFDVSMSRYADWKTREAKTLRMDLWVLGSPERRAVEREFMRRKLAFLRKQQAGGLSHAEAVAQWYAHGQRLAEELGYGVK